MHNGMRVATQGMMTMSVKQDIITNNLANASTTGFRRESLVVTSFDQILNKQASRGMHQASTHEMTSGSSNIAQDSALYHHSVAHTGQGALKETGNPFDLALDDNGRGYFTVQTDRGIEFTRGGSFHLSSQGFLVTSDGSKVMGHQGPIQIKGDDVEVGKDGVISVDGKKQDRLLISVVEDPQQMQRVGDTSYASTTPQVSATNDFKIHQGYVEQSNVNALQEMVGLMEVMRNFEAGQKALQAHDGTMQKVVSELGRVR